MVVVIHHCMLTNPGLAAPFISGAGVVPGSMSWLVFSPLHLFWAGTEAVDVFFVLSGFVLVLPYARGRGPRWQSYYPQRLARLYLPVAGSLLLAWLTYALVDHHVQLGASWWMGIHDGHPTWSSLASDLLLVQRPTPTNSVLWSLRWEVAFSLLVPLVAPMLVRPTTSVRRLAAVLGCLVAIAVFDLTSAAGLGYLLMFAIGGILAADADRVRELARRLQPWWWWVVGAGAVALLLNSWWFGGPHSTPVSTSLSTVGAALIVVMFLADPHCVRLGNTAVPQWLGRRSFSLYLVHEPVVVSTALLLHSTDPASVLAVAGPTSLAMAALFHVVIEKPSHRLARRIGSRVNGWSRRSAP